MFKATVGHSLQQAPEAAVDELLAQCQPALEDRPPTAGLLFSTHGLDHARMLQAIQSCFPDLPLVGCSSLGEVSHHLGYRIYSSTLVLFQSDRIRITAGVARDLARGEKSRNQRRIGHALQSVREREIPALCLLFPDGVKLDGAAAVEAFQQSLGAEIPVFGAAAADRWTLTGSAQFHGAEVLQRAVPFLLFHGPLRIASAIAEGFGNGWLGVGEKALAEVEGDEIHRIAGKPAVEFFQSRARLRDGLLSVAHPLAVFPSRDSDCHEFRNVIACDEARGTLRLLQALSRRRVWVQMTVPIAETLLSATRQTLFKVLADFQDSTPAVAFWFSCTSRAMVLNSHAYQEYANAVAPLALLPPIAGFYGYGEIGPGRIGGPSLFHSSSLITLLLGEDSKTAGRLYEPEHTESLLLGEIRQLQESQAIQAAELAAFKRENRMLREQLAWLKAARHTQEHDSKAQADANKRLAFSLLLHFLQRQGGLQRTDWFKGEKHQLNIAALVRSICREATWRGQRLPISRHTLRRYLEELLQA